VGLIGHCYQGDVDSEPFALKRPVCHRVTEPRAGSAGVSRQRPGPAKAPAGRLHPPHCGKFLHTLSRL
jgi:hypothetical protein